MAFDRNHPLDWEKTPNFKADVAAWLRNKFGADVGVGKKAITISGNASRRDADVIVCAQHRRYRPSSNGVDTQYDEGIVFWTANGTEIVNFPKQHAENCTTKHNGTDQQFKRIVRVYKNMRNRMIDDEYIADGVAPSYFVEGMLWNVPSDAFVPGYEESFVNAFNWLQDADEARVRQRPLLAGARQCRRMLVKRQLRCLP